MSKPVSITIEAIALGAVLYGLQWFFAGTVNFQSWPIHPSLIIVLVIAAQYGLIAGVLVAAAGTALYLAVEVPAPDLSTSRVEWLAHHGVRPAVWIGLALLIGGLTDLDRSRIERLRDHLGQMEAELAAALAKLDGSEARSARRRSERQAYERLHLVSAAHVLDDLANPEADFVEAMDRAARVIAETSTWAIVSETASGPALRLSSRGSLAIAALITPGSATAYDEERVTRLPLGNGDCLLLIDALGDLAADDKAAVLDLLARDVARAWAVQATNRMAAQ
ncbi:hypothetical protein [Histidinibacterium aquaticum]|uniref:GAF domain-containing protein n=1 Tax=Histidinibacterium aquaticum TaxID=2613962 RepID=A0A5J5GMF4_9RHOB|nr:hypothetical protein [Histidinibacterium aquaticum]KAA9009439.1 hypothetical protein F3S47_09360 [Histidinibacterium aquaticum]